TPGGRSRTRIPASGSRSRSCRVPPAYSQRRIASGRRSRITRPRSQRSPLAYCRARRNRLPRLSPGSSAMALPNLNPAALHSNPAFPQGTVIPAGSSIVIVGGQNGIGPDGKVVGDSIGAQTEQALRNLIAVLAEAGATPADVAKLNLILVEGVDLNEGFAASQR